ncbi:MAG: hypothetical protein MUO94_03955 [Thermoplasmata archaeon]|nr:hypothetical protein [Thermoplasmata archaeon]
MFLLWALGWFIIAIVELTLYIVNGRAGELAMGLFGMIAMVICFMAAIFLKKTVVDAIDQGRFHDAKNDTMVWVIIGFVAFGIPSVFLILTYVKLGDAITAQAPVGYMPYQTGNVAVQAPPNAQHAPPPAPVQVQQAPPAQQHPQHPHHPATPMLRCKNCNVQYPTFMHTCPNCGAPKE